MELNIGSLIGAIVGIVLTSLSGLILWIGKQRQSSENTREAIVQINERLDKMNDALENKYIKKEFFNQCLVDILRRIDEIEGYKIPAELATIKAQLAQILAKLQ